MDHATGEESQFSRLSSDLIELVLSFLPVRSLVRASAVCRLWKSIITRPGFGPREPPPAWFFLCGLNNVEPRHDWTFGFDPASGHWARLPTVRLPRSTSIGGLINVHVASRDWLIEDASAPCKEIGRLPGQLLKWIFNEEEEEEEEKFESVKCLRSDGMIYLFNDAHHGGYRGCYCELKSAIADRCEWRRLPPLPSKDDCFHRVVAFCSAVRLDSVLSSGKVGEIL